MYDIPKRAEIAGLSCDGRNGNYAASGEVKRESVGFFVFCFFFFFFFLYDHALYFIQCVCSAVVLVFNFRANVLEAAQEACLIFHF